MWFYWTLFLWPAGAAIVQSRAGPKTSKPAMYLFATVLALVIGLRFQVGVDWYAYLDHVVDSQVYTWREVLRNAEPVNGMLNWIAGATGTGVWLVNLGCAIPFATGLLAFCRRTPNPWLALAVGMPYMAIVMAMNYTRQGAALGCVLWGLIALEDGRTRRFIFFVVLAALFHKSAALLMPLGALASTRNWFWAFLWISLATGLVYLFFLAGSQDAMIDNYFGQKMFSDGANVRVAMNSAAALTYLALRNNLELGPRARTFWTRYSLIALLFIPALILSPSSTAVDRVALYFMPLQLLVFSQLPRIAQRPSISAATVSLVISAYAIVLFVWFNYSPFAYAWLPYRFYPFEVL